MIMYFDMDGTLADLYPGEWLNKIEDRQTEPFDEANKLIAEEVLKSLAENYDLGIITWLPKDADKEYGERVRQSKINWLNKHYPDVPFKERHIVIYGTPKSKVARDKNGILVDDENRHRDAWKGVAIKPEEVYNYLEGRNG